MTFNINMYFVDLTALQSVELDYSNKIKRYNWMSS